MPESEKREAPKPVLRKYSENMYLLFKSEEEAARYFEGMVAAIAVTKNDRGEWGYSYFDSSKNEKKWMPVEIPKNVKDLPPEM
jgi:hypothetical protein